MPKKSLPVTPPQTTRNPHEISTAYHEAGHAVAAFFLHLRIGRKGVTIIPDKVNNSLGTAQFLHQIRGNREALKIAELRAGDLVDAYWEITAVATALLDRKTLTREDVRQAIVGARHSPRLLSQQRGAEI